MSSPAARSAEPTSRRTDGAPLRVAFLGAELWLDGCAPSVPAHGLTPERFPIGVGDDVELVLARLRAFKPQATVVFDPAALPVELLGSLPAATLGVLVGGTPGRAAAPAVGDLDRLVAFDPALTGMRVGSGMVWRAVPPPVSDALFQDVRSLRHAPRAMSIGRSTAHREAMLMPVKHHHDLLQVIHGVSGAALAELLSEYDVGVYVASEPGGGFAQQVGVHLAAGQLLLAETLTPAHGLERDIDYLQVESPDGLVWVLDRLGRFPEMYQRIRFRGRLKAEQYRASRLFGRLTHDLLADVGAFGSSRSVGFSD